VPDDGEEEHEEDSKADEELVLSGDAEKLSSQQRQVMLKLKEAMQYSP
jgi:hypothetical protein